MTIYQTTLILGGCRSGKSRHALELAQQVPGKRRLFVATCVPHDDEMHLRVARHQRERSANWRTLEIPTGIADAVASNSDNADVIVVDCLTLWMSNLFMASDDDVKISREIQTLTDCLYAASTSIILVSNELGMGIVPENTLARRYRDAVGHMNQAVAACVKQVIWTVAGLPFCIKPNSHGN